MRLDLQDIITSATYRSAALFPSISINAPVIEVFLAVNLPVRRLVRARIQRRMNG